MPKYACKNVLILLKNCKNCAALGAPPLDPHISPTTLQHSWLHT